MNIQKLKIAWFSGWRIVGRLILLYLAMMVFLIPLAGLSELLPNSVARGWILLIMIIQFFVALPFGAYYAAKWCKEFKDEVE
jgi:hypothetical protein